MSEERRPMLVAPRQSQQLEAVRQVAGRAPFDPDIWHVMDERDNALIAEEVLHGAGSSRFVYDFKIATTQVVGISVVGARHLASAYGGMKHRLVASTQKTGSLFQFTSFPSKDTEMRVSCAVVHELASEPDFYGAVIEITDIKTGNAIQIERRENRHEHRQDGSEYERPNYATIAQSKAYRNGILALIPQDVQIRFKEEMLKLKKSDTITESVFDMKRAAVLTFAAKKGIPLERAAVEELTFAQIAGLSEAAHESQDAFIRAAVALGLAEPVEGDKTPARPRLTRQPKQARNDSGKPAGEQSKADGDPRDAVDGGAPPAGDGGKPAASTEGKPATAQKGPLFKDE